jgi:chromosome segregation ATPase
LERDVADARAQVALIVEAEKKSIERAKIADKKLEEAKIVVSASKQASAALQNKINALTSELSAAQLQVKQCTAALSEEKRLRLETTSELDSFKCQSAACTASLQQQLQSFETACAQSQSQAEELRQAMQLLQAEIAAVRSASDAQVAALEAKLAHVEAARSGETARLALQLSAAENACSMQQQQLQQQLQQQQQQQQQESARQQRERVFVEQKLAKLEEQQAAAAATQSAANAALAEAERAASAANERVKAVSAVFKKMSNLDEGLEGDCTCLRCMQALADPVLLQVIAARLFAQWRRVTHSALSVATPCVPVAVPPPALARSATLPSCRFRRRTAAGAALRCLFVAA